MGAARAVVTVLVGTVEQAGEVLHIAMLLLNRLNQGLRGDVLTMLIATQAMTVRRKLLMAARQEDVVGRLSRQARRERRIRLLGAALGREVGVGDLRDRVLLIEHFGVAGERRPTNVLGVDEVLLDRVVDVAGDLRMADLADDSRLFWGSSGGGGGWLLLLFNCLVFFQFVGTLLGDVIDTARHTFI